MTKIFSRCHSRLFLWSVFFALMGHTSDVNQKAYPRETLQLKADEKYQALLKSFASLPYQAEVFWQIGMALDPMIDYCSSHKKDCSTLGEMALEIFTIKTKDGKNWWRDDYGWWGHAFSRLYGLTKNQDYLEAAKRCLRAMRPAKESYKNCQEYAKFNEMPCFDHGCYNTDWTINAQPLEAIQNTVTNAQFLRLSLAIFKESYLTLLWKPEHEAEITALWQEVMLQYKWFLNWFNNGLMTRFGLNNDHILIEERVGIYRLGGVARGYQSGRYWLGDQALMMAIFSDLSTLYQHLLQHNQFKLDISLVHRNLSEQALGIAKGVKKRLVNQNLSFLSFTTNDKDPFPFGDDVDYSTGPAVYLTSVIHCANSNDKLKTKFKAAGYRAIVQKIAADIMVDNPTLPVNALDIFIKNTNELAALNTELILQ